MGKIEGIRGLENWDRVGRREMMGRASVSINQCC